MDVKVADVLFKLTPVGIIFTVTAQVAVFEPVFVVTVIVAVPFPTAVTKPLEDTVATFVLLDFHVTVLSAASVGDTVAVNCTVAPLDVKVAEVLFRLMPVGIIFTVTAQVAVFEPVFVVTIIVAVPFPTAVTKPLEDTVATFVLLDAHVTDLSVAFDGVTVAVS